MSRLEKDEQKMRFIHGLYQRLITCTLNEKTRGKQTKAQPFEKFKWDELSGLVLEQTVTLLAQVSQLKEAVSTVLLYLICCASVHGCTFNP